MSCGARKLPRELRSTVGIARILGKDMVTEDVQTPRDSQETRMAYCHSSLYLPRKSIGWQYRVIVKYSYRKV